MIDFFSALYHTFLYQPFLNALILLSQILPGKDFGVAVITLTLLFRLATYPLAAQALRAQKKFGELQSKVKEIQEKFKNKKEDQTRAILELYKKEHVNPLAGFLPILIQMPVFIVLYQIFARGLHEEQLSGLYSFIPKPQDLDPSFLGLVNLNEKSFFIALLAGVFQFIQLKQAAQPKKTGAKGKPDMASMLQVQMLYLFPLLLVWIASSLPSAFGLYLIATTVFSIWQQWLMNKKEKPKLAA